SSPPDLGAALRLTWSRQPLLSHEVPRPPTEYSAPASFTVLAEVASASGATTCFQEGARSEESETHSIRAIITASSATSVSPPLSAGSSVSFQSFLKYFH